MRRRCPSPSTTTSTWSSSSLRSVAENENVVEWLTSQRASEAFGEGVQCPAHGRADHARVDGGEGPHELRAELRVVIADQHLRCVSVERGVARLLRAPRVGGCVTAACTTARRRRSRKNRTKILGNRAS